VVAVAAVLVGFAAAHRKPAGQAVSASGPAAGAAEPGPGLPAPTVTDPALRSRPGTLRAQGDRYVVEEVPLDPAAGTTVFRITISGGPFPVRDAAAIVAVDGVAVGVGIESADLSALMAFTSDPAVLRPGAILSYAYGRPEDTPSVWSAPVELAG
jgi:hypothetical protein